MEKLTEAAKAQLKGLTVTEVSDDQITLSDGSKLTLDEGDIESLNDDYPDDEEDDEEDENEGAE